MSSTKVREPHGEQMKLVRRGCARALASLRPTRVRSAHGSTPDSAFADRATVQGGGGLGIQMRAAPARPAHPHVSTYPSSRHRASIRADSVGTAWETAQFAAGAASGAALTLLAWPAVKRELQPVRCASCRGMSWNACKTCRGRGRTGLRLPGDPPKSGLSYCKTCGPRAVSVRRVRGHGRGEQLAVRPDREPGVGAEGTVARPGPTAAADAREVTPRRARGSAARAVL